MKRSLLLGLCMAAALMVQAAVAVPDLGNARIIVLANNLQNYYYNYDESERPSYSDDEGRAAKTQKIVQMMLASNADIFAFCEVEAKPITLKYLVSELNKLVGDSAYTEVYDGINVATDSYDNAIKSGFIYKRATVQPLGSNYAATKTAYYKNTMRIQAWTEIATGESFTLSMNHFKAGQTASDPDKRVTNAQQLLSGLATSSKIMDPDILVMGDFNAQMDEDCITLILAAGYEEQLLRFDENAYSYVYRGAREFIDHAFANSSMAQQITGAAVWHTNTSLATSSRYSDHDAVMVGLRLGDEVDPQGCEETSVTEPTQKILRNGQLIIIRSGVEYTITGTRVY